MAGGFHPFSIGDISAQEIGALDRTIRRRLGLRLQSKTPARKEEDEHHKNKLRFRDHHCRAAMPVLRSVYCPARIIAKRSSRATHRGRSSRGLMARAALCDTHSSIAPRVRPRSLSLRLFNHFVRAGKENRWHVKAKRLGSFSS